MSSTVTILRPDSATERLEVPTAAAIEEALKAEGTIRVSLRTRSITAEPTFGGVRISVMVFDVRPGDGRTRAWSTDAPVSADQAARLMMTVAVRETIPGFLQALLSPE